MKLSNYTKNKTAGANGIPVDNGETDVEEPNAQVAHDRVHVKHPRIYTYQHQNQRKQWKRSE